MWLRMAKLAQDRLPAGDADAGFYEAKLSTARFYMQRMLPHGQCALPGARAGKDSLMALARRSILIWPGPRSDRVSSTIRAATGYGRLLAPDPDPLR